MEKEQILSTLIEKVGKTSLSSRTIETYVSSHMPADGTEPDDAYWDAAVEFVKSLEGQFSHDVADAIKKFKSEYKPEPSGGGGAEPNPGKNGGGQEPPENPLLKEIEELKKRLDERDKNDATEKLRSSVEESMKAKGATDAYVLRNVLREAVLDEKKSVNDLAQELLEKYDAEYVEAHPGELSPRNGGGGSGGSATAADLYFKRKKEREGWGK